MTPHADIRVTATGAAVVKGAPSALGRRRGRRVVVGLIVAVLVAMVIVNSVAVLAALGTGFLNVAAGGGAVVTFLALTMVSGVAALTAHATSQLVTPFSFLSALRDVRACWPGLRLVLAGCLGTLLGVGVLKITPAGTFQALAPVFLVPAALLVVLQGPVKRYVGRTGRTVSTTTTVMLMFGCGVYAGLIGVGTGTLALVVLGLTPAFADTALKELLLIRNVLLLAMALLVAGAFAATGLVDWTLAALLVLPGAFGGWVGTKLVRRMPVPVLQFLIALTALGGAAWMALR